MVSLSTEKFYNILNEHPNINSGLLAYVATHKQLLFHRFLDEVIQSRDSRLRDLIREVRDLSVFKRYITYAVTDENLITLTDIYFNQAYISCPFWDLFYKAWVLTRQCREKNLEILRDSFKNVFLDIPVDMMSFILSNKSAVSEYINIEILKLCKADRSEFFSTLLGGIYLTNIDGLTDATSFALYVKENPNKFSLLPVSIQRNVLMKEMILENPMGISELVSNINFVDSDVVKAVYVYNYPVEEILCKKKIENFELLLSLVKLVKSFDIKDLCEGTVQAHAKDIILAKLSADDISVFERVHDLVNLLRHWDCMTERNIDYFVERSKKDSDLLNFLLKEYYRKHKTQSIGISLINKLEKYEVNLVKGSSRTVW